MKIFGCGDIFIAKRLPLCGYDGFEKMQSIVREHEACFGNLETTIHANEGYPSKFPGGGYAMAAPKCLQDLQQFGFNALNIANNHTLDYSHKGLEATMRHLYEADMTFFGAGINLADAARPKYIECKGGRCAFIGCTSSFHDSDAAGPAGGIIPGRPGVNPLRRIEYYQLTEELYQQLQKIAEVTGMNDGHKWSIANGYRDEVAEVYLREMRFVKAEQNGRVTRPLEEDMKRIKNSIKEASIQADCKIVSFHSHQMEGTASKPMDFIVEFCHECVDAGADIILGHGSHELRGLELYKGKPIFYGLGDFIFHNEMQEAMPKEFYEKIMPENEALFDSVGIAMNIRSRNETRGLQADPKAWESIGASVEFSAGEVIGVSVYPITLGQELGHSRRGWPKIDESGKVLEYFTMLSKEQFGTIINSHNGIGYVEL